jgi:hypothetical protein
VFEFTAEFGVPRGFAGQMKLVAAGKNILTARFEGVADHDDVFVGAKDEAELGIVTGRAAVLVVVVHIQLKLVEVFERQFADVELNERVGFQVGVVENEINVEAVAVQRCVLLPCYEPAAFTQLQQEGLEVVDLAFEFAGGIVVLDGFGFAEDILSPNCRNCP